LLKISHIGAVHGKNDFVVKDLTFCWIWK